MRDEAVAGALVGAVVIVLGYASGIGAPAASQDTATPATTPPPAATAPATPTPTTPGTGGGQYPVGTGELPSYGGVGGGFGYGGGGVAGGTGGTGGSGGSGHSGHHPTSPPAGPGSPAPSPTPTAPGSSAPPEGDTCGTGEVSLVKPLLTGLTTPVFGLLGGGATSPEPTPTPTPTPTPCVGLAPVSVPGLLGIDASPLPEATP